MTTKARVSGCVLLLVSVGLAGYLLSRTRMLPIDQLATAHWIAPEDWGELAVRGGLPGQGWVLLPKDTHGPLYRAAITAETSGFLPPESCAECHREKYESFKQTAHAVTSALPSNSSIKGSFEPPGNRMATSDQDFWFEMHQTTEGYFHELHVLRAGNHYQLRRPIDLVLGSGNHGQSYLYWERDRLYQHHVSYLSELNQWVNSPGLYHDSTADYARPVPGRCLDCHATWFGVARDSVNRFDRNNCILGVTCVRCHGDAGEHVEYHRRFPEAEESVGILNPARLSAERLNELCAQCHSGGEPIAPPFSYQPGEPLSSCLELQFDSNDPANADPHSANQLARLMQSRCYEEDKTLNCITCHDPHRDQRGATVEYSAKCIKCHEPRNCGEFAVHGDRIQPRCVECHMPSHRDLQVSIDTASGSVKALLRDHQIGIWPDAAREIQRQMTLELQALDATE
jgi:hypothetical protein